MQDNKPKLSFHCQLAHGSLTKSISGFTNVRELYKKIADCYGLPVSEILFCTVNSHKIDMNKLLSSKLLEKDFIFAHVKGKTKDVTLTKSEKGLGITVTDNGTGYVFIKNIQENSIMARHQMINIGDHIEQIDKQSMLGMKHLEVAQVLKDIPLGSTFRMYLVEPKQSSPTKTNIPTVRTTTYATEESHSTAQVHIPSVDLTGDKSCNSCQVNGIANQAVVFCKSCREFYCPSCRDCHKAFKLTRDHVLAMLAPKNEDTSDVVKISDFEEEENSSDVVND